MKILILGAGAVASILSEMLAKDRKVTQIVCGAINVEDAKKFIKHSHKKIRLIKLNANKTRQIRSAAKGMDLIINASLPNFNEKAMKAALKSGCDYQDLCSHLEDLVTPEQLKYHKKFQKAGLTAIINTGVAPGITNLLARDIADKMGTLEELKFRLLEEQESEKFIPTWSIEVTIDELTSNPLFYHGGRNKMVEAFDDEENYEFPEPFGNKTVCNIYGDEVSTLPKYVKVQNITYKSGGSDMDYARIFKKTGLLSKKPISIGRKKIAPLDMLGALTPEVPSPEKMKQYMADGTIRNAQFISIVEGIGYKARKKISMKKIVTYPDLKKITRKYPGATYISYPAALAAYLFTKNLPLIKKTGVLPPEALEKEIRDNILKDLKKEITHVKTVTTRAES